MPVSVCLINQGKQWCWPTQLTADKPTGQGVGIDPRPCRRRPLAKPRPIAPLAAARSPHLLRQSPQRSGPQGPPAVLTCKWSTSNVHKRLAWPAYHHCVCSANLGVVTTAAARNAPSPLPFITIKSVDQNTRNAITQRHSN